ncbi:site-specific integrase [Afipia sp. Root123D2]|uniref:tyrosine-type recombinase/integrase n=1 Tax=Afipia sp. Root123D2 TaxID=1736436 RepID=UPI00138EE4C3|nr:site-specific integrase [Afipia sp. Root123D2]
MKAVLRKHSTRIGADGTIRRELNVLGTAARFTLKRRFIKPEDMPSLEVPAEPPGRIHHLTRDELKRVFKSATGSLRDFISIAYYTGARRAAVEGLRWDQVDLEHGHINFLPADATPLQRKSRKRRPIVPIDPQLRPTLERLRIRKNDWDFVLPPIVYADAFRRHMTALGMPGKRYPHILRHTRATHLLQDGISIYNVARLLGDNPMTVERVYGHHSSEFLGAAIGDKSPSLG